MSLSRNQLKLITGLTRKKYRNEHKLFVVEGIKAVNEFLAAETNLKYLYYTDENADYNRFENAQLITERELSKMSALKTPNRVLAVFEMPEPESIKSTGLIVALDNINDPGNLGTIIRLCDWFGVDQLVCSENTVDCYNHKVVQATMGSLTRVSVVYTDLTNYLKKSNSTIIAADMNGNSVYDQELPEKAVLVMGSEANGISEQVAALIDNWAKIPSFGMENRAESLNVATATAIFLSEFRRKG